MGSNLSTILSIVFMEYLGKNFFAIDCSFEYAWFRFFDDVYAIITLKSESIHLKIDIETEYQLPFLDTLDIRSNNALIFKVYRQPTHSNRQCDALSDHSDMVETRSN